MAIVTRFEFDNLSQKHLERLQRMRDELERTIELQHSINSYHRAQEETRSSVSRPMDKMLHNGLPASLKDYWKVTAREKNVLRYEVGAQEWRGESVY